MVFALDQSEAITRDSFEFSRTLDLDQAPLCGNEPLGLEVLQTFRDARAPYAEELAQHLVGE